MTPLVQLEIKVVVPAGQYLTANDCQNSDLFFALRGGGGGTFGVVMEATMRALPQVAFPTYVSQSNLHGKPSDTWPGFLLGSMPQIMFSRNG